jgi:hypothetical protein
VSAWLLTQFGVRLGGASLPRTAPRLSGRLPLKSPIGAHCTAR